MYSSIPICRVCLKTSLEYIDFDTPFVPDVPYKEPECFTYLDCFKYCTRLEVDYVENESFCSSCGLELKVTYEFLKKAENAANILCRSIEQTNWKYLKTEDDLEGNNNPANDETLEQKHSILLIGKEIQESKNNENSNIFTCEICDKKFLSKLNLNLHVERLHLNNIKKEGIESDSEYEVTYIDEEEIFLESPNSEEEEQAVEYDIDNNVTIDIWENSHETYNNENVEIKFTFENEDQFENKQGNEIVVDSESLFDHNNQSREQTQSNESSFKRCKICHRFIKLSSYDSHMHIHADAQTYVCSNCPTRFYSKRALQVHLKSCHQTKLSNICKTCETDIGNTSMKEHIAENHEWEVSCEKCDFKGYEYKLRDHMQKQHSDSKDFLCNICSKTFVSLGILNAHIKYHERKTHNFKSDACEICGKKFSTNHYLRSHMDVHKNDRKLFKCDLCDKMYVSKTALYNHMKLHKGETKNCLLCSKQFARQYELNVHMRFHTREYPFECNICGKKFAIKGHLRTHMWRHQGLKLQCEDCGKLFTSTKALQEHSFSHSEMPYPCPHCPKAYPSKQKFKVHLKTSHELVLNDNELQKFCRFSKPRQLVRKKVTLVQADTVMKEIEIKTKDNEDDEVTVHNFQ